MICCESRHDLSTVQDAYYSCLRASSQWLHHQIHTVRVCVYICAAYAYVYAYVCVYVCLCVSARVCE